MNHPAHMESTFDRRVAPTRELVACGLWLRIGTIGASALAFGLIALFGGEPGPVYALAIALAGGALAVFAWRRALNAIEADDSSAVDAPKASSPVRHRHVGRVTSNASH
jgi:hypothetical protein